VAAGVDHAAGDAVLPFSGVLIDREDRRHIVMLLDAGRALMILMVALLAIFHPTSLQLLACLRHEHRRGDRILDVLASITALIQELTHRQNSFIPIRC